MGRGLIGFAEGKLVGVAVDFFHRLFDLYGKGGGTGAGGRPPV